MTTVLAAHQAALAAELRALYGYALIGPRVGADDRPLVRSSVHAHLVLRDHASAAIQAGGAVPVSPEPDYPDLYPVPNAADAQARAAELEDGCAAAWRFLYAQTAEQTGGGALRETAQRALTASAVRATRWRMRSSSAHPTVAFPGIG